MEKETIIAYLIAGFVTIVGSTFLILAVFQNSILVSQPPGQFFLIGISSIMTIFGIYYLILLARGKVHNDNAKTVVEIRIDAVKKLNDHRMLVRIAEEDAETEIGEAAKSRLMELGALG